MADYVFPPPAVAALEIAGQGARYPVNRIFCIGRNYADHAAEMGAQPTEAPFFFTKSPAHLAPSGTILPYPQGTADLHHEVELVVALGEDGGVWGRAVGIDLTRRDLQGAAKAARQPWDVGKDFEGAAVIGALVPGADLADGRLTLTVNGETRQDAPLSAMLHDLPAILAHLAGLYRLGAGDIVMTGTPAGVGPLVPDDRAEGRLAIAGTEIPPARLTVAPPR